MDQEKRDDLQAYLASIMALIFVPAFSCLRSSFSYCSTISSLIGSLPSELTATSFASDLILTSFEKLVYRGRPTRTPSPGLVVANVMRSMTEVTPPAMTSSSGSTLFNGLK